MGSLFASVGAAARLAAAPLLAVALSGCPGRTTTNQMSQHITLTPAASGYYLGYSGTTFSQQIPSNKQVHLLSATLTSSTGEFSWASSLVGSAGQTAGGPVILSKDSFAGTGATTDLDIVDTGDLLPLYPTQDFAMYWQIDFASALAQSYPDGIELTVNYVLDIE
jgi:hypothetical protein